MNEQSQQVFFYGLFMDPEVLLSMGVEPPQGQPVSLADYALHIGQRATLAPANGERVYGMLYRLSASDLERLYGAPGLEDYHPELVQVVTEPGNIINAHCYNLPTIPGPDEGNPAYRAQLKATFHKLGLPDIIGAD
ncbi:gamma-glutamylcyclotransferase family protein [Marinicella sediminis]|uniref:Gamma-glutamylcyclotransferase family protein n=1 Tax=Marinicella sediminis TaxID=1792834 RepID=A0ABV7J3Y4_9GAMM|nr:gamma-glutamylcyclotransferase family protein [Marinicella sediminis]